MSAAISHIADITQVNSNKIKMSISWDMGTQKASFPLDFIPRSDASQLPYVTPTSQTLFSVPHMRFALSSGGPKAGPREAGPSAWP